MPRMAHVAAEAPGSTQERQPAAQDESQVAVARAYAQALAARCRASLACTNLVGLSEAACHCHGRRCSGCRTMRFCCRECSVAAWPAHRQACCTDMSAGSSARGMHHQLLSGPCLLVDYDLHSSSSQCTIPEDQSAL